jgi:hypothetical protein
MNPALETELTCQAPPETRPPEGEGGLIVIESGEPWFALRLRDLWTYRELLGFLVWRDVKVRYKQTALGAAWALLQPLMTMLIFTLLFGRLAKLPSDHVPYPLFVYTALLPWQLFAFALTESSNSLVGNQHLIRKVYFPRLVIPIASVLVGLVDFAISLMVLAGMMAWYGGRADRSWYGALALCPQHPIPRREIRRTLSHPVLDVRYACGLLEHSGSGEVEAAI